MVSWESPMVFGREQRVGLFLLSKMIGWTCFSHCEFKELIPQECRWGVVDCGTGRECFVLMTVLRKGSEQEDCGRKWVEDKDEFRWKSSEGSVLLVLHGWALFILLGRNRLMRKSTCLFPSRDRVTKKIHASADSQIQKINKTCKQLKLNKSQRTSVIVLVYWNLD